MICDRCNGTGHDKGGKPVVKFVDFVDDKGRKRKQHVTESKGSGCLKCLGRGQV